MAYKQAYDASTLDKDGADRSFQDIDDSIEGHPA